MSIKFGILKVYIKLSRLHFYKVSDAFHIEDHNCLVTFGIKGSSELDI